MAVCFEADIKRADVGMGSSIAVASAAMGFVMNSMNRILSQASDARASGLVFFVYDCFLGFDFHPFP